jgi:TorA maturation chaperone TorD
MRPGELACTAHRTPAAWPARHVSEREQSLATATVCRLIADGFSEPDTLLIDAVRTTARDLVQGAGPRPVAPAYAPTLRAVLRAWRAVSAECLGAEYSRLFLGAGLVPLREGGYGDGLRFAGQPIDIADLNGFYRAFGFEVSASAPNPPDHLGTEVEFLSLLHIKRAMALDRGRRREVRIVDHAMARFLEDHLARWVGAFGLALREAGAGATYVLLAELAGKVVSAECARLGVRPRAAGRGTAIDPMESDELICPLAAGEPVSETARDQQ